MDYDGSTLINFIYKAKAVWWGTAHAASRSTGDLLLTYDNICMVQPDTTLDKIKLAYDIIVSDPEEKQIAFHAARGNHYFSYFTSEALQSNNYYTICNIRNPYAKFASLWKHSNFIYTKRGEKTTLTLKEYAQNMHKVFLKKPDRKNRPATFFCIYDNIKTIKNQYGKEPDLYLRAENLKKDVLKIPFLDFDNPETKQVYQERIVNNLSKEKEIIRINKKIESKQINNPKNLNPFSHWKTQYDQEAADIVYYHCKSDFEYFGYNKDSWKEGVEITTSNPALFS